MILITLWTDHILHWKAHDRMVPVAADMNGLEQVHQGGSVIPGHVLRPVHHIIAILGTDGHETDIFDLQLAGQFPELVFNIFEHILVKPHQVHFIHRHDQMRDLQQGGDIGMPDGLFQHAVAGVHEDHSHVGRGSACDHVTGILYMSRRVGNDELPLGGGKIAVGHINGDALFPFGPQTVGEQCQVDLLAAGAFTGTFDGLKLVLKNSFAVIQQTADEGALTVIHTACRGKTEELHVQISVDQV